MKRISRRLPPVFRALPLALLLTASACQKGEQVPAPAQLLPPEKMANLLIDLHTLEARTEGAGLTPDSSLALFRQEQKKIYWRHEVTDSVFAQNFRYYAIHGQDLSTIYKTVVDSLARREAKLRGGK